MTIKQLQYFLRIAELKSFSKAAAHLHVAQPALGLQVRKLEEELGVKLLNRHSRGVTPTEAGLLLRDHALVILRQVERARLSVTDLSGPPRGKIAVGVTPTLNLILATQLVERCRRDYPEISLSIVDAMSEDLMEWVENDRLDIAYSYNPSAVQGLICEPLLTEDLCLIGPGEDASASETARISELAGLPLILTSASSGLRSLVEEAAARKNLDLNLVLEIDSVTATKEMVAKGIGFTILPLGAVRREVEDGRLTARRFARPALSRNMYLAYSASRPASNAMTAIREVMREVVQENLASGHWSWRRAR
ncbi:MAG: LysR substrate-binding domain-containing protein [Alphaproteobacteria bacterium]|nr:LysR substrate-binding domain-containing protein [Alphaproteobacteria bacterium]